MFNLKSITLKNIVTYKEQYFEFKPGLSLVKGENRAGKSLLFSSIANLLYFSHPLAEKKDVKSLLSSSQNSLQNKENLSAESKSKSEGSSISLEIETGQKLFLIKQKAIKDSVTYQVSENNVDLGSRTIALSKDLIEGIFEQPEDIFFTSTYLTSYRNHPLLHGSTAQRYEFFEKLFNFDFLDYLHEHFSKEQKIQENNLLELQTLKSALLELPRKEQDLMQTKQTLLELKGRRDVLQGDLSVYTNLRLEVLILLDIRKDLTRVQTDLDALINKHPELNLNLKKNEASELVQEEINQLSSLHNLLTEEEKSLALIQNTEQDIKTAETELNTLQNTLKGFLEVLDKEVVKMPIEGLEDYKRSLESSVRNLQIPFNNKSLSAWLSLQQQAQENILIVEKTLQDFCRSLEGFALQETFKTFLSSPPSLESIMQASSSCQTSMIKAQYSLEAKQKQKETIRNLKEKNLKVAGAVSHESHANVEPDIQCPTCLSVMPADQLDRYLVTLTQDIEAIVKEKQLYSQAQTLLSNYKSSKEQLQSIPDLEILQSNDLEISRLKELLVNVTSFIPQKRAYQQQKTLVENLKQKLTTLQSHREANNSDSRQQSSKEIQTKIDTLRSFLHLRKNYTPIKDKETVKLKAINDLIIKHPQLQGLESDVNEKSSVELLDKIRNVLDQKISNCTTENTQLQSSITNFSITEASLQKEIILLKHQEEKCKQLEKHCEQAPLISKLVNVFHTKGFRLEKIKHFTKVFEAMLNKFSPFLFMEPFTFTINVEKRDLQIIATRSEKASDVRYLSGSESRCFQLLCLISILALLPQHKRANICILDEMDAGCDENTTRMFYEHFLPELRNIVPSITVITPLKDNGYYIKEDHNYFVRKVDGVSSIQEFNV
jgi:exonuclease SbcC